MKVRVTTAEGVLCAEWFGEREWTIRPDEQENADVVVDELLEPFEGQRIRITIQPILEKETSS